ncbi:MAG TPA: M56 family metallopeptidase [Bryobacteraceae bacterium]|nr:M56 family metallopeptidase [Bryobacteraceae bacterium]
MTQALASVLLHFLWEGVLICCVYSCLRVCMGSRGAVFRYSLACAAMLALSAAPIVTFMICLPHESAGSAMRIGGRVAAPGNTGGETWFAPAAMNAIREWRDVTANWIVLVWLLGIIIFSIRLAGGWMLTSRLRSQLTRAVPLTWQQRFDELRARLGLSRPVRLVASPLIQSPTVIGWWRPVVLVPLGAFTGLEPALVAGLLAHELMHIRRHDYLVNALQCAVEAVLFYHPAVWWISRQIREEREQCCDDMAVALCGDTLTYVRALAELESRRTMAPPALAATGGSLAARIARLLGIPAPRRNVHARSLAAAGLLATAMLIVAVQGSAQSTVAASQLPAFDVASIKPSNPDTPLKVDFAAGGRLMISHATLRFLIKIAYDVGDDQILGGPGWINSKRFDLEGKPLKPYGGDPATMTGDQILVFHAPTRLRLQRLLADRFQLELLKSSQPMPVFALLPGRNGPKLNPGSATGDTQITFNHGILQAKRVDMKTLARFLSEGQTGRPVIDETGIDGKFDFRLEWTPDPSLNPAQPAIQAAPADAGISVFTALQQQLGLRLEPRSSPADALLVKRAELPSAN